jgi:hypothetical protein
LLNQKKQFLRNVIIKTVVLLIFFNLFFIVVQPVEVLSKISAYNVFFPGRIRFPFGENPSKAYNLTINSIPAMFSSHIISNSPIPQDEFSIIFIGDSSVWGYLLRPNETISAYINQTALQTPDGESIHAYNLGYPTISLTKDLVFLQEAVQYNPDFVIWLVTLEAFPLVRQLDSPILQANQKRVTELNQQYRIGLDLPTEWSDPTSLLDRAFVMQRKDLADLFRLQVYGLLWAATGVDQYYPESFPPPANDLENNVDYYGMSPGMLDSRFIMFKALDIGSEILGNIPLLIVNEPIYISDGENSEVRYNFFYPRWAYDQYRDQMMTLSQNAAWLYLDTWDLVAPDKFTNSAIHMNPTGTHALAVRIQEAIVRSFNSQK